MNTGAIRRLGVAAAGLGGLAAAAVLVAVGPAQGGTYLAAGPNASIGEARRASLTVTLAPAVEDVVVSGGLAAGRPIVVIDPGHGGRDPGAPGVSGEVSEKQLTLEFARELRDRLVERGRVRVALTRDSDRSMALDQRAGIARRLGASLFVSLHMDSAPNPLARGASVYSLSDVASDADAARFARSENASGGDVRDGGGSVAAMLSDLNARSQMTASADLANRVVRKSAGRFGLRPEPHRFAAFQVLRRAEAPAVLFEAGYLSNVDDEALLRSPGHRSAVVAALAQAIEIDVAARSRR